MEYLIAPQSFADRESARMGRAAAWTVFLLEMVYVVTTVLGLLSLKSPQDPIGDPFFTIMELLIILMAPLMVVVMVALHAHALPDADAKAYSLTALILMMLMAGITSSVHFVILAVSRQIAALGLAGAPLFFPSDGRQSPTHWISSPGTGSLPSRCSLRRR